MPWGDGEMIPGPGSPIAIPLALLLGLYFLEDGLWKTLCGVGLVAWVVVYAAIAVSSQQWALLMYPAFVFVLWGVISEAKRLAG